VFLVHPRRPLLNAEDLGVRSIPKGDCDAEAIRNHYFTMEYPFHSGQFRSFPEVDRTASVTIPHQTTNN